MYTRDTDARAGRDAALERARGDDDGDGDDGDDDHGARARELTRRRANERAESTEAGGM